MPRGVRRGPRSQTRLSRRNLGPRHAKVAGRWLGLGRRRRSCRHERARRPIIGRASPINLPRGGGCKIQKEDRRLYLTTPRNTLPAQQRASFALCAMSVRRRCAWSRPGQRCGAKPAWSRRPAGLGSRRPCRSDHEHTAHDRPRERLEPKRSAVLRSPAAATAGATRVVLSTSWRPVQLASEGRMVSARSRRYLRRSE